jgi:putative ABC transport system permease protein
MRSMDEVTDAAREIERIVHTRHRPDSVYQTQTMQGYLTIAGRITTALTLLLVAVSCVTLAVGGVGIMNIMLAGVRARVREIGIRKALGATRREIKLQFLTEAVIISLTGGIAGSIVGLALPVSARLFTNFAIPITPWSVVIALTAAVLVGIIFGTVPATRAAQLNPVDALKYE